MSATDRAVSRGFRRSGTALLGALLAVSATPATPATQAAAVAAPAAGVEYIALGDSFAAGPTLMPQDGYHPDPCLQSDVDYPHLLARDLGITAFRDVTCSGATSANVLTTPQTADLPGGSGVPLQIGAVSPSTALVTLTIGANDIDLAQFAAGCVNLMPPPLGTSCKATETAGGVDKGAALVAAEAPRLAAVLDAVHQRAPQARILITSYADYFGAAGCFPRQPFWPQDAAYLQGLVDQLGRVTEAVAAQHHAQYVDFIGPGAGHDGCRPTSNWVNLIVPGHTGGTIPMHPTLLGEQNFARIIVEHLAQG
ncbi:SGNH/GDSL hydrolase family protein [Streptacidiphilus sp. MAP5-3]|uniref:SGNH/GDSL hydrolase family protein n=1 Tax=unclassified Streptacidiphilus TaxID=2643834 RepID=UPI003516F865